MNDLIRNFIGGFCEVEFLCSAGSPNWLGSLVLICLFVAVLYFVASVFVYATFEILKVNADAIDNAICYWQDLPGPAWKKLLPVVYLLLTPLGCAALRFGKLVLIGTVIAAFILGVREVINYV